MLLASAGPGQGPVRLPFTFKFQVLLLASAFNIHLMHSTSYTPAEGYFQGYLNEA